MVVTIWLTGSNIHVPYLRKKLCKIVSIADNEGRKAIAKVLDWQANISIYKCPPDEENAESFFIYLLEPAPADQTAYCAGEGFPCPEGEMHNGFECVGECQCFHCDTNYTFQCFPTHSTVLTL